MLLCDDNAATLEITGTLLEERGYHVMLAHSAEEAVERALTEPPNVLLLDLNLPLPGMSGAQTVRALREHAGMATIRVVVLSVPPRCEKRSRATRRAAVRTHWRCSPRSAPTCWSSTRTCHPLTVWTWGPGYTGELRVIAYDAGHVRSAARENRFTGAVTRILTKGQISAEEFP